jgi:plastocyanin
MRDLEKIAALALFVAIAGAARGQTPGIDVRVVDQQGTPVADAVVVAVPADPNVRFPARLAHGNVVDQIDKQFVPRVQVVEVGTAVTFPNNDHVRHQVYSFSPARRFELPLYAGVPAKPILFDKPGIVVLGCNIHDWMIGYIYVSESPYFAKTRADGTAVLANLPPRAYVVRVWHPQMSVAEETTHKTVDVIPGPHANAAWTLELTPESGIRRAPAPGQGRGY